MFNNYILTKFYYVVPFTFFYHIVIKLEAFFKFTKMEEYDIACYFYKKKVSENALEVYYQNGHTIDKELFKETIKKHFPEEQVIKY
jgi:hypothetical protein